MTLTTRREHAGGATPTTTSSTTAASGTTISITNGTGWPTGLIGDFVVTIARGTDNEERVLCSDRTGNVLTVATSGRGWDDTVAREHASGSVIEHTWSTTEADEASAHGSSVNAHGVGVVVGTTEVQDLSNKTLTAPVVNGATLSGTLAGSPTFSGAPVIANLTGMGHDHGDADDGGNIPQASVTGLVAALAAKDSALTAHEGDISTHGVTEVVGRTETQTLTNKTLTAPTIADFTSAQHDHGDANDGGQLVVAALPDASSLRYWDVDVLTAQTANVDNQLEQIATISPTGLPAAQRLLLVILNIEDLDASAQSQVKGQVTITGPGTPIGGGSVAANGHGWGVVTDVTGIPSGGQSFMGLFLTNLGSTSFTVNAFISRSTGTANLTSGTGGGMAVVQLL